MCAAGEDLGEVANDEVTHSLECTAGKTAQQTRIVSCY
jgi:hypothetical protein